MDSANMRASSSLPETSPHIYTTEFASPSPGSIRTGIEAREVVLRQFHSAKDIVVVPSDEDDEPVPKRRRVSEHLWSSCSENSYAQTQDVPTSISTNPDLGGPGQPHIAKSKKRLFHSTDRRAGILHQPSLPTPPTSPYDVLYATESADSSSNSDTLNTPLDLTRENDDGDERDDTDKAAELSIHLSHFFDAPKPSRSLAAEEMRKNPYKIHLEALGVQRSRALRDKRREEIKNGSQANFKQPLLLVSSSSGINASTRGTTKDSTPKQNSISKNKSTFSTSGTRFVEHQGQRSRTYAKSHAESYDRAPSAETTNHSSAGTVSGDTSFGEVLGQVIEQYSRPRTLPKSSEADRISMQNSASIYDPDEDTRSENERLDRMKKTTLCSPWLPEEQSASPRGDRQLPTRFHMPDFNDGRRSKSGTGAGRQGDLRKLMGLTKPERASSTQDRPTEEDASELLATSSTVNISTLQRLKCQNQSSTKDIYDGLQPHGIDLFLPPTYDSKTAKEQSKIRERQILREREKDFETVRRAFEALAKLGAIRDFKDIEMKELDELRKFCLAIFDKNLSGKRARDRIANIATKSRKRIESSRKMPPPARVDQVLQNILKPEYLQILNTEGEEIKERLQHMGTDSRKTTKGRRFKAMEVMNEDTPDHATRFSPEAKKSSKRSRISKPDQKIAAMENVLARFKAYEAVYNGDTNDSDGDEMDLGDPRDYHEGDISEEDDREHLVRPIGLSGYRGDERNVDDPENRTLEDTRTSPSEEILTNEQKQTSQDQRHECLSASAQMRDQSLIDKMQFKQQEQAHLIQQKAQIPDHDLLQQNLEKQAVRTAIKEKSLASQNSLHHSVEKGSTANNLDFSIDGATSDQEFEDPDFDTVSTDDEGDEEAELLDEDARPQCWRYIVKLIECNGFGFSTGTDDDLSGHESVQGRFARYDCAKKRLEELVGQLRQTYREHHQTVSDRCWNSQTEEDHEKYDLVMTHVDDSAHGCHFRIERELYTPSREAYEKAKVQIACQPIDAWFVDWERVICAYLEDEDEDEEEEHEAESVDREEDRHEEEEERGECTTFEDHCQNESEEQVEELMQQAASSDNDIEIIQDTPPSPPDIQNRNPLSEYAVPSHSATAKEDCTAKQQPSTQAQTPIEPCSEIIDPAAIASLLTLSSLTPNEENFDSLLDEELFGSALDKEDSRVQTSPPSNMATAPTVTSPTIKSPQLHDSTVTSSSSSSSSTSADDSEKTTATATAITIHPDSSSTQSVQGSTAPASTKVLNLPIAAATTTEHVGIDTDNDTDNENATNGPLQLKLQQQMQCRRCLPAAAPEPKITRLSGDELRIFSSIAHANRYASECFLDWYTQQPSVIGNQRLIDVTKSDIEEELAFSGHLQLWVREEQFTFVTGEGCEMVDRFRVWVRKAESRGPRN